ncbi:MAG TPA: PAS domain S-box protein [Spirochaetia bacterium]|nr:PAS domain S-box protein [Spirochaetia bacterium]
MSQTESKPPSLTVSPDRRTPSELAAMYRALAEHSGTGILLFQDEKVIYANSALRVMLGYGVLDTRRFTGASIFDFVHAEDRDRISGSYRRRLQGKKVESSYEARLLRSDGTILPVEITASLTMYDSHPAIMANIVDVSQRKRMERKLQESEQRLRAIVNNAPVLLLSTDSDGVILFYEGRGFETADQSPAGVVGEVVFDRYRDLPELLTLFRKALGGAAVTARVQSNNAWFGTRVSPVRDEQGKIVGTVAVAVDVTALMLAEQAKDEAVDRLRQGEKMESIGRLAGGIAHDFNNLLTVISGNALLARGELGDRPELRRQIDEIVDAAESAADLARQLLTFSRKQESSPRAIRLGDSMVEMGRLLPRLLGEDIALEVRCGEELGSIALDPGQLEQVIVNLAVNARDAMPDGGRVLMEASNVEQRPSASAARPAGEYVQLLVHDEGAGMAPEVLEHIFEPFFTTKPEGKGTGLGLATVYGIVKQNGGTIEVESAPGAGTTFRVLFPRVAAAPEPEVVGEDPAPCGTETVLLVEDNDVVRNLTELQLHRLGYKVFSYANGNDALAMASESPNEIHLLLTDVIMPGMNGRTLADSMQAVSPRVAVVYMSGYTTEVINRHGVLEEGIFFIPKPFTLPQLARKLREALDYVAKMFSGY